MRDFFENVAFLCVAVGIPVYVMVRFVFYDLHREWGMDWTADPRIYLPVLFITYIVLGTYFWRTFRDERKERLGDHYLRQCKKCFDERKWKEGGEWLRKYEALAGIKENGNAI